MNLEPPNLNVPLYKRDYSKLWLPVLAGLVAWTYHHPMAVPQAAISFFVGGAFLWFVFGSGFSSRLSLHKVPLVRGLWYVIVVSGVVMFMQYVIPFLHALV